MPLPVTETEFTNVEGQQEGILYISIIFNLKGHNIELIQTNHFI
jgi:hypothetical protein